MQQAHLTPPVWDQSYPPSRHYAQGEVRHAAHNKKGGLYERGHTAGAHTQWLVGIRALVFGPLQAARNACKSESSPRSLTASAPASLSRWCDKLCGSGAGYTSGANTTGSRR